MTVDNKAIMYRMYLNAQEEQCANDTSVKANLFHLDTVNYYNVYNYHRHLFSLYLCLSLSSVHSQSKVKVREEPFVRCFCNTNGSATYLDDG